MHSAAISPGTPREFTPVCIMRFKFGSSCVHIGPGDADVHEGQSSLARRVMGIRSGLHGEEFEKRRGEIESGLWGLRETIYLEQLRDTPRASIVW